MSRITDMVEAEATAAEAEDETAEGNGNGNGNGEPEPAADETTAAAVQGAEDAQMKAFEKHMKRHRDGLRRVMGDDFEAFTECTYCDGLGYRVVGAPRHHPRTSTCEDCAGHGFLLTGSENPAFASIPCESCQGNGYRTALPPATLPAPQPQPFAGGYYNPQTGEIVAAPPMTQAPDGTWAPGYNPAPQPLPPAAPGT